MRFPGMAALVLGILAGSVGFGAEEEVWEGILKVKEGLELKIVVHVVGEAGKQSATWDSPDQGAEGLKVDVVSRDKSTLMFEVKGPKIVYEGKERERE